MGVRTLPSRVIGLTLVYVLCSKKCVAINRSCETVPREIFERLRDVSEVSRPPALTATTDDNFTCSFDFLHSPEPPFGGLCVYPKTREFLRLAILYISFNMSVTKASK